MSLENKLRLQLMQVYGDDEAHWLADRLAALLLANPTATLVSPRISERDAMIIAYGDHLQRPDERPLVTLRQVLQQLAIPASGLHILPFYPYSSDDGFSVIDYYAVDPALGTWADVHALSHDYRLMFDAVFNHISAHSTWFQAFLRSEAPYTDYFVTAPPDTDLSAVTRPRTHPVLSRFETAQGTQYVWTTFSDDQIDLNAANPAVLLELIKVLLFYIEQGARFIRLDAIAFLWKEIGTTCIHLPNTHRIIQLMRTILDITAPDILLITETNVPHVENLSYFGDGTNEAQMVYQFALPPLILHTLRTGDASRLTAWAQTIQRVSARTTFFNFTASHDGIGVRPVKGLLSEEEIAALVQMTRDHGGHVSMKSESDGSQTPYELNITYFDAITPPAVTAEQPQVAVQRFIVSQAMMLALIGVPGIYLPSLLGARNDAEGVRETGRYRTINREKFDGDTLLRALADETSLRHRVFTRYQQLLAIRTSEPAFHPLGDQNVIDLHPAVFTVERTAPDGGSLVIALHNVTGEAVSVRLPVGSAAVYIDLLTQASVTSNEAIHLAAFQVQWLKPVS